MLVSLAKGDSSSDLEAFRLRKDYDFGSPAAEELNRAGRGEDRAWDVKNCARTQSATLLANQKSLGLNGEVGKASGTLGGLRLGKSRPGQVAHVPDVLKGINPMGGGPVTNE